MQVSVEVVNDVKRRMTIVVPASQIEDAYVARINQFAQTANIKGFRPGKAPKSYIQQRYGDEAKKEAYLDVMKKALHEALEKNNLNPVSMPEIEPKRAAAANEAFEFVASFEVLPQIGEVKFELDSIDKLDVTINQSDIDHVIEQLKKQYTKWNVVDREVQEKDKIVIDYYTIIDDKADLDNKISNFPLEIGSQIMIPGFETGLVGAKRNEEIKLSLTFPDNFSVAEQASKPVIFVITVKQIFEAESPVVDNQFIKNLGVASGNLEDLVKQVQQSLEIEKNRLLREKRKEKIFNVLIEKNSIEIPDALITQEAKSVHDEIYAHDAHHEHSDNEDVQLREIAKKRVTLGLLMNQYTKQANLKVDQNKVNERIEEIASIYEKPEEVRAWLAIDKNKSNIEAQVLEDQIVEKLLENIPVNEKSLSFHELKDTKL